MLRGNRELWLAFLAMLIIAGVYALVFFMMREIPPACTTMVPANVAWLCSSVVATLTV